MAPYYRQFARYSASFAVLADIALLILGGELKRKESLSGRFADALSYMYLGTACLKHYKDHGEPEADRPLVEWAVQHCLYNIQSALDGILRNFPSRPLGVALRGVVFPLGRRRHAPDDRLTHRVAELLLEPSETRDRLTAGMYLSDSDEDAIGGLEDALRKVLAAEPLLKKLKEQGHRFERAPGHTYRDWVDELVSEELVTRDEGDTLMAAREATLKVIAVDDFPSNTTLGGEQASAFSEKLEAAARAVNEFETSTGPAERAEDDDGGPSGGDGGGKGDEAA